MRDLIDCVGVALAATLAMATPAGAGTPTPALTNRLDGEIGRAHV